MKKIIKKLFYIICLICFCSCSWVEGPIEMIDEINKDKNISYYENDTINITVKFDNLPYEDENIRIYADSFYVSNNSFKTDNSSVLIYNNGNIYIETLNYYKIKDIKWYNTDMWKTIEITHTPTKRIYWCGSDIYLGSVNILLVKEIRKVICG